MDWYFKKAGSGPPLGFIEKYFYSRSRQTPENGGSMYTGQALYNSARYITNKFIEHLRSKIITPGKRGSMYTGQALYNSARAI